MALRALRRALRRRALMALRRALRRALRALAYIHLISSFPLDICYLCLKRLNLSVA